MNANMQKKVFKFSSYFWSSGMSGHDVSLDKAKEAVDKIVTRIEVSHDLLFNSYTWTYRIVITISYLEPCMQTDFEGFNISEIVKAGSLGHGTAVQGHYDIDLVIYSRGV